MNNLDGTLPAAAIVYIDRHRPSAEEKVGEFVFSDMAEVAAAAICERYHYRTIVRFPGEDHIPDTVFEWATKSTYGVVMV